MVYRKYTGDDSVCVEKGGPSIEGHQGWVSRNMFPTT